MVSLIKYGTLGGGEKYETNVMTFDGLSSDDLPVGTFEGMAIPNGSSYCETDTGVKYLYDEENEEWYEQPSGGGGGGGGTDNYNDLSNKPKINGVTLTGDKSLSALDIVSNTTFEQIMSALDTYLNNEVQPKITSQNRLSADLVEEENDKYFASEDELDKIDAILDGQDYFVGAIPLASGDDMNDLEVGKYEAVNGVAANISHSPTNSDFVAFTIETTSAEDCYLQIVYEIGTYAWFLRHGVLINGSMSWIPWQEYSPKYDSTLKLLSDYVDDSGQTNRFVTAAEKAAISSIGDKVDKIEGKELSTNDYTTAEKNKLSGLTQYTDALASAAIYGLGTEMTKNTSFDSYTTSGAYYAYNAVASTLTGGPVSIGNNHVRLEVVNVGSSIQQRLFIASNLYDDKFYVRRKASSGTWSSWYVHTGAVVT